MKLFIITVLVIIISVGVVYNITKGSPRPNKYALKYALEKKLCFVEGKCPYAQDSYRIQVRKFVDGLLEKDKKNILKNFEVISKKQKTNEKINYCKICGEPSRNQICKRCELMNLKN